VRCPLRIRELEAAVDWLGLLLFSYNAVPFYESCEHNNEMQILIYVMKYCSTLITWLTWATICKRPTNVTGSTGDNSPLQ
jgi:hypothetical protein